MSSHNDHYNQLTMVEYQTSTSWERLALFALLDRPPLPRHLLPDGPVPRNDGGDGYGLAENCSLKQPYIILSHERLYTGLNRFFAVKRRG